MPSLTTTLEPQAQGTEASARATGAGRAAATFHFDSLVITEPHSLVKGRSTTAAVSLVLHAVLIAAMVVVPLFFEDVLPVPGDTLRAFFVQPVDVAPPPPPPPPPPAGARASTRPQAPPPRVEEGRFTAPVEVPTEIVPEEGLDLGIEGGVPGGVEGGVPGGVLGGVVGGLPQAVEATPPPRVVRIGGSIIAPKLVKRVQPVYPSLASQARLQGLVIIEAQVDTRGAVKTVKVLRGAPLFDEPALEAVRQWRYQPLLLNGQPTEFIVVVTVMFNLKTPAPSQE
jgi:protein TonB